MAKVSADMMFGPEGVKNVDKLAKGIEKAKANTEDFGSSVNNLKAPFLAAAAAAAGLFFAVKKITDLGRRGAELENLRLGFANLASKEGLQATELLQDLQREAGGTISEFELLQSATQAKFLGVDLASLPRLLKIARGTAAATGQNVEFLFRSIVIGLGRQQKLILDNLGIVFDARKAQDEYARSLGRTAASLSETERKQAFTNAALKAGEKNIADANVELENTATALDRLSANMSNLATTIGIELADSVAEVANDLNALVVVFGMIRNQESEVLELVEANRTAADEWVDAHLSLPKLLGLVSGHAVQAAKSMAASAEFAKAFGDAVKPLPPTIQHAVDEIFRLEQAGGEATFTLSILKKLIDDYVESLKPATDEEEKQVGLIKEIDDKLKGLIAKRKDEAMTDAAIKKLNIEINELIKERKRLLGLGLAVEKEAADEADSAFISQVKLANALFDFKKKAAAEDKANAKAIGDLFREGDEKHLAALREQVAGLRRVAGAIDDVASAAHNLGLELDDNLAKILATLQAAIQLIAAVKGVGVARKAGEGEGLAVLEALGSLVAIFATIKGFAHGGIVPPAQTAARGSAVPILAHEGEIVLNKTQQENLLRLLSGAGVSAPTVNVMLKGTLAGQTFLREEMPEFERFNKKKKV